MASIQLVVSDGLPGVTTRVLQEVDFGKLTDDQMKRVLNTLKRGYTYRQGYVAALIRMAAKQLGVEQPPSLDFQKPYNYSVGAVTVYPFPAAYDAAIEDLLAESEVRTRIAWSKFTDLPDWYKQKGPPPSGRGQYWRAEAVTFHGWDNRKLFEGRLDEALAKHGLKREYNRLAEFIASKPKWVAMDTGEE